MNKIQKIKLVIMIKWEETMNMVKKFFKIMLLIMVFVIAGVLIFFKQNNMWKENPDDTMQTSGEEEITNEQGLEMGSGDKSHLDEKNITYDEELGIHFINNQIMLWFYPNVKDIRCNEIIEKIDGEIVSTLNSIDCYVVRLNQKFDSIKEMEEYGQKLMEQYYGEIESVDCDSVFEIR